MTYLLQENIVDDLKVTFYQHRRIVDHLNDQVLNIKFSDQDYVDIKATLSYLEVDFKVVVPLPTQTMSASILQETDGSILISYEDYVRVIKEGSHFSEKEESTDSKIE